jgi:hypothetical protein
VLDRAPRLPAEAGEEPLLVGLDHRVEPQRPLGLGPGAGGPDERGAGPRRGSGRHHQAAAGPPAQVGARPGDGGQAHPTHDRPAGRAGDEHDRALVGVEVVGVTAVEQALLVDEHASPQLAVRGHGLAVGLFHEERRPGHRRPGPTQMPQERLG